MKKVATLLLLLLVAFFSQTNAQVINTNAYKFTIKKARVFKQGSGVVWVVSTTFTNLSKDTLKYFNMNCSWQDMYVLNNKNLNILANLCDKNTPVILKLAPNRSSTVELKLLVNEEANGSPQSFRLGVNLVPATKPRLEFSPKEFLYRQNIVWSNEITM